MKPEKKIKAIISMIGLDGHTTGGEVVSRLLRDSGIEVVYLGVNQTPEMIAKAAVQEDVDAIGISSHASNYSQIIELVELLKKKDMSHVPVFCGGTIPKQQVARLKASGVAEVFLPRSTSQAIVTRILDLVRTRPADPGGATDRDIGANSLPTSFA
ncbi:MAG: cobalamin B12-binding domain-containing protein [Deltaproteobacteria bacterium]|nr:cobalamin B12-binding domain-containing protein [Deltaproteobacteria bacterium]